MQRIAGPRARKTVVALAAVAAVLSVMTSPGNAQGVGDNESLQAAEQVDSPSPTFTPTPTATTTPSPFVPVHIDMRFDTMPQWSSIFDATDGATATWEIVPREYSGNCLRVSRTEPGNSVRTLRFPVPRNTWISISIYASAPEFGWLYWSEVAYSLGDNSAETRLPKYVMWRPIQIFSSDSYGNGNNDMWTWYGDVVNTGEHDYVTLSFNLGSFSIGYPTAEPYIRWDSLFIHDTWVTPTPAATPTRTFTPTASPTPAAAVKCWRDLFEMSAGWESGAISSASVCTLQAQWHH